MAENSKIERLTPEQEASLATFREHGLRVGLSTEPCDRLAAEAAIKAHYRVLGRPEPRILIWMDGPAHGAMAAALLAGTKIAGDQVWAQVRAQVWDQVWAQVRDQVRAQVWAQVRDQVRAQVRAQVGDQVWDQVGDQVWAQVRAQVWDQVWAQVWAQVRAQVWAQVRAQVWDQVWAQVRAQVGDQVYRAGYGSQDMEWAAWAAAMRYIGVKLPPQGETLIAVSETCGWWWPFDGAVVLSERPTCIKMDDVGRLHSERGPAVEYRDGTKVSSWHGQPIPHEWVAGSPPTAAEALHWSNMDQRAAACEIVGWANILDQLNARVIDDSGHPKWGRLVEVDLPGSPRERFLDAMCGTQRRFALPVPPNTSTVDEAQSVLHGGLPASLLRLAADART